MPRKKSFNDANICKRIKELRLKLKLTGTLFAKKVGISKGYLYDIENRKASPNKTLLLAISYVYSVNLHWLLTGEGDPLSREGMVSNQYNGTHKDLINMVREVLSSGSDYSSALESDIRLFYKAVHTERSLEKRLSDLEEQHRLKKKYEHKLNAEAAHKN